MLQQFIWAIRHRFEVVVSPDKTNKGASLYIDSLRINELNNIICKEDFQNEFTYKSNSKLHVICCPSAIK